MEKIFIPLLAVLLVFSACSGDIPLPEESENTSRPAQNQSQTNEQTSIAPEENSEDIKVISPVVSPDGEYTFTVESADKAYITHKDGNKTDLPLSLYPENARITAALWGDGKIYITFTAEKDILVCWDMLTDPVYIKEWFKNSLSPLEWKADGIISAGVYLLTPYHDGSKDGAIITVNELLGYIRYYAQENVDPDNTYIIDENGVSVNVTAEKDCRLMITDYETGTTVCEIKSLKAGETVSFICRIPEGIPAYEIALITKDETGKFTLAYDGRGETDVYFITPEIYK